MADKNLERRRVLLVDDEEVLAWSLATRITKVRSNYSIETAFDGETALAKVHEEDFDLLIADVRMPGMSGIDLIVAARSRLPELPVVVMTAFKTPDVQRIAGESRTDFIEKPFEFDKLLELVDAALVPKKVGFSGAISVQTLPDVVQLYILANTTGRLDIGHHTGKGQIWFNNGAIRHAVTRHGKGEEAFFEIMMWNGGEFGMRLGATAPEQSIKSNWQELLMESCRRIDERRRTDEARSSRSGWTQAPPAFPDDIDVMFDAFGDDPRTNPAVVHEGESMPSPRAASSPQDTEKLPEDEMNIKDSLAKLNSIDGFVGAALVDGESGMLLGQEGGAGLNLEVAAAGNTEVIKAKRKTMNNLNIKDQIEDFLITLGKQYHLIRPLRSRSTLFFYVALDRQRANLAMARIALADVEKDLTV